ncbi:hypothetical protein BDN70DRAFT_680604 [Pholiota conissans]|uniref:F-box domain-containing protein n=1 Tax=Pholiota conissans TaxID=109636 RepID=A0A9P5ZEZ2_9AGAR|nr:hypothetical protein BDN70DRAFT_680604 [Pholiota conissans]
MGTDNLSSKSPISKISNATLREIFLHCLPQYPLENSKEQQPKTTIAPLLLCRICSSWRKVALASTALWSHFSCALTVYEDRDGEEFVLVKKEVEFVRWWRKNQGTTPPLLRLRIKATKTQPKSLQRAGADDDDEDDDAKDEEDEDDDAAFLVEYIASAQYLDLDAFYWKRVEEAIEEGNEIAFPNMRTLVKNGYDYELDNAPFYGEFIASSPSMLQRISAHRDCLTLEDTEIPTNWSALTHMSIRDSAFSLDFWFALIRAVPNLQWGYFDIRDLEGFEELASSEPDECTLPHLSTLCVAFRDKDEIAEMLDFSTFFKGLHLPAVRTLSLSWFIAGPCFDRDIIGDLYKVLKCTPAVTTLALAECSFDIDDPVAGSASPDGAKKDRKGLEAVWRVVPDLVDLQFVMPQEGTRERTREDVEEQVDGFMNEILFTGGTWLDLRNHACPIRNVTIMDSWPVRYYGSGSESEPEDGLDSEVADGDSIGDFAMSCIKKHDGELPNIVFELSSNSVARIAADAWKEWGSI